MPTSASAHSSTGRPPAGVESTRRNAAASSVGIRTISHSPARMPVADVDHGSETTSATANPSASRAQRSRSIHLRPGRAAAAPAHQPARHRAAAGHPAGGLASWSSVEMPRSALTRRLSITRASRCSLSASWRAIRVRVPEMQHAGRAAPSLRRTPGMQQPHQQIGIFLAPAAKAASKPSTRSRSARQTARLQERAPSQVCGRIFRNGPSGRRSTGASRLRPPLSRCPIQSAVPHRSASSVSAQHLFGQRTRQQRAIAGDEPAALGERRDAWRQNPAAPGSRHRGTRNSRRALSRSARLRISPARKPRCSCQTCDERHAEPRLPLLDQRRGRRPRAIVGDHHLEAPVGLARQRPQHRVERIRAIKCRDDDGDQIGHARLPR